MLNNFKIYPKIDYTLYSKEFETEIENAEGVEIQLFNGDEHTVDIDIKERLKLVLDRYPNLKEITIHPPLYNYDIEQIVIRDEKIIKRQLKDIIELSDKYNIKVHMLYHTNWTIKQHIATGLIDKIKDYLKILEGHDSYMFIENLFMFEEETCSALEIAKYIDHPNLKVCIDTTHLYCKANIYKTNIMEFLNKYLDKEMCEKYVYQIHFAKALDNDGYIRIETHGRVHESNETLDYDLRWMKDYNLLDKNFVVEVSEDDYRLRTDQLKEILMLREEIKKYM